MTTGLQTTFRLLTETPNEAAVAALVPALDSPTPAIQEGALRAILRRRGAGGKRDVLLRLERLGATWRDVLGEYRGRLTAALRDAVLGADETLCVNGCQAILWFGEYDLMPALINAAEDHANPHADLAARTLVELADQLFQELAAPRDYRRRRDPYLVRQHVVASLELALKRYAQHKRIEIVEAALILMNRDNAALKRILLDPHDGGYLAVLDVLKHSPRAGVSRLLLSYLEDPQAPSVALSLLANRNDPAFLKHLTRKIGFEPTQAALHNLKRVSHIGWLQGDLREVDALDDQGQHALVQAARASSMKRLEVFALIAHLLRHGKPGGRRAAAAALADYQGAEANELVLAAMEDPDPRVQAQVLPQLRTRGIPGALPRLIRLADSPHEVVRAAVRDALSEFNFERYLAGFETMSDEVRRTTGLLVKKVDPHTIAGLAVEMAQPSRTRRLRALEICETIEAGAALEPSLLELIAADDHLIRAAAARALAQVDRPAVRAALAEALNDRSIAVSEAAEESLRRLNGEGDA